MVLASLIVGGLVVLRKKQSSHIMQLTWSDDVSPRTDMLVELYKGEIVSSPPIFNDLIVAIVAAHDSSLVAVFMHPRNRVDP